jgi:hypothetical protein
MSQRLSREGIMRGRLWEGCGSREVERAHLSDDVQQGHGNNEPDAHADDGNL